MIRPSSPKSVRTRLQPGTRIGSQLRIREVLGQGGTAVVYEAEHLKLRSSVALKVAHARDDDSASRLLREGQVCASLVDARIPRVYDMGELEDGRPYLVMEKVDGVTLDERLKDGPFTVAKALELTGELLRALEVVHRADIVHRDVKPANLLVRDGDQGFSIHLMDFGVSKSVMQTRRELDITAPGALVGTPLYMAPEQFDADELALGVDLYAVGVILYEMLTGRPPFEGHSTAEVMVAVLRRDHPPIHSLAPHLPVKVVDLVERAMSERAGDRFHSARAMREAVEAARGDVSFAPRTTYFPSGKKKPKKALLAAGAVAMAALTVALFAGASEPPESPRKAAIQADRREPEPEPVLPPPMAPTPAVRPPVEAASVVRLAARPQTRPATVAKAKPVRKKVAPRRRMAPARSHDTGALLDSSRRELEGLRGVLPPPRTRH